MQRELAALVHGFDFALSLQSGQPKLLIFVLESTAQPAQMQSQLNHLSAQLLSKSGTACEELEAKYLVLCKTIRGVTNMTKS